MLLSESCGLVSICNLQCNHSMVRVAQNPYPYFNVSSDTPTNLEGRVPVFISPRNKVAQLYPGALGSLYVASYDSQGYGGGILTLPQPGGPGPCVYIPQEQDGLVQSQSQSHVTTDGKSLNIGWMLCDKRKCSYVLHRSAASCKRRRKGNPMLGAYNWATLFQGDINTGTWHSRLGESQMRQ
jgi:hypothetical protein